MTGAKRVRSRYARSKRDQGFTLIELLIVITIIPIIIGALAGGLLEVFSLQNGVANRISDSADAQVISSTFTKDVQSSSAITTYPTSPSLCGPGTQLLGLEWGGSPVIISYSEVQSGTTYSLVRDFCATGTTLTSSSVLSTDVLPPCPIADSLATCATLKLQPAPVAYAGTTVVNTTSNPPPTPQGTPVTTVGITSVQFPIVEPGSAFTYQLEASPAGGPFPGETNLGLPQTGSTCGFALPGTGSFANTMCFVGFTTGQLQKAYVSAGATCTQTNPGVQGVDTFADVPGGYLMTFCLSVAPGEGGTNPPPVVAVTTPVGGGTCNGCDLGARSNGQGFLGNNDDVNGTPTPFYAGIGCPVSTPVLVNFVVTSSCINPAIFQTSSGGTDTVTLSNIQVFDPQGSSATGYEVITADAETIDPGGYIKWASASPASKPLPFNLVPNFNSSDLGNACNQVPDADTTGSTGWGINDGDTTVQIGGTNYSGLLTGLGTANVECTSNWQTDKPLLRTGTAMLGITPPTVGGNAEPVTISATLNGEGFNAVAFGLLLP